MRFIEPVKPRRADGLVAEIYDEVKRDFGLLQDPSGNSPFTAHSPHPELLAGLWSVLYETVLIEDALTRAEKEAIAAAVSRINDCPFCTEAHALLSGVAGERQDRDALIGGTIDAIPDQHRRALVGWAAATREPENELLRRPPFGEREAPEAIGTTLAFHYVNRVVEVLQGHEPMNVGPAPLRGLAMTLVGAVARRAVRRPREPGRTLRLLPEAELPNDLAWATPSPTIASAWARFAGAVERAGEAVLSESERSRVTSSLAAWDGADPPLHGEWLAPAIQGLGPGPRAKVQLALFAALAPYRVDTALVESFRRVQPGDRELVGVVCWSSLAAARRIASWLVSSPGSSQADEPRR